MEIDNNVKRDEVAKLVVELMEGGKGKEIRKNVIELKNKALEACTSSCGSSMNERTDDELSEHEMPSPPRAPGGPSKKSQNCSVVRCFLFELLFFLLSSIMIRIGLFGKILCRKSSPLSDGIRCPKAETEEPPGEREPTERHSYHLVDPSPWPISGSLGALATTVGGLPVFMLWTSGAASLLCFDEYPKLLEKGLMPLKDLSYVANGYLDTVLDCIPAMPGIRLKDIPPFIRYINPGDEYITQFFCSQLDKSKSASAFFFNTFDELDCEILDASSLKFPPCYSIGPLHLLENKIVDKSLALFKCNLWKEDIECVKWLDLREPSSVIYVNFGSITVMTSQQLVEFGWGLAKSSYSFLWIIRPDLVIGESAVLPPELLDEIRGRGLLANWCPQEQVLNHSSIGGFLTHSGWNSTLESISCGVPMICWPFFGDQQPNCWMCCNKWGVSMEIDNNVTSDEVRKLVIELMKGEKGNLMRKKVVEWKNKAKEACTFPYGSSVANMKKIVHLMQTSTT
ncbi:hypothetical protein QVD17_38461 [Tagetes erecta]|uniref:Glycosyltransferase n=1 Tax=Tagetes erecta TaxID=13708 RepID=A0AAD8JN86_TARER|nr:hypothetical protein QVD17_38461 [Tagetes erecta]